MNHEQTKWIFKKKLKKLSFFKKEQKEKEFFKRIWNNDSFLLNKRFFQNLFWKIVGIFDWTNNLRNERSFSEKTNEIGGKGRKILSTNK